MGKLLKYEYKKSAFMLYIALASVAIVELVFLLGVFFKNDDMFNTGLILFIMLAFFGIMALLIYSVTLYTRELTRKSGYMLIMTPASFYKTIGAKLLISFIALLVGFFLYTGLAMLNIELIFRLIEESSNSVWAMAFEFITNALDYNLFLLIANMLVQWFATIITIYLAYTLTYTFLAHWKAKGVIAFAVFLGINYGISAISSALMSGWLFGDLLPALSAANDPSVIFSLVLDWRLLTISMVVNLLICVVAYLATAFMAEKKLSV